jgi:hypothetical protein
VRIPVVAYCSHPLKPIQLKWHKLRSVISEDGSESQRNSERLFGGSELDAVGRKEKNGSGVGAPKPLYLN